MTPQPRPSTVPNAPARPWVKICGLKDEAAIDRALLRGADALGFVHFAPSPRHLPLDAIASLIRHVGGRAETVIVTVDPDDALLDAIVVSARPSAIQLHGTETPERVSEVEARTGLPVIKALSVGGGDVAEPFQRYTHVATRLLLDAKAPKGSALPGGNGVTFDWRLLEALREAGFILSGGLNAGNVAEAIRVARPAGLDVSSGVEASPGEKSLALIDQFFDALDAAPTAGRQHP